jgi:hypothetical protein
MIAILTGVKLMVLIYISFRVRDGEHFFMCFFIIWTSFEKEK